MSFRRRALFLTGLFVAVSCSDAGNPLEPETPVGPRPEEVLQALTCTVSVNDPEMRCTPSGPETGGALGNLGIVGGANGQYVRLTKINHFATADSMWFDVTVQNLTGQTLGTVDGVTADADSVRVFFERDPVPTAGGDVTIANADGAIPITTGAPQTYYEYPGLLADSAVSPARRWTFHLTGGATRFTFEVLVRAKVQFPRGWLRIAPRDTVLQVGDVLPLTARVRNRLGEDEGEGVTWTSSDTLVVKLSSTAARTAQVEAVGEGAAWIKAQSDTLPRVDSVLVTVNNVPVVATDSIDALANVTDSLPAPRLQDRVTAGGGTVVPDTVATFAGGEAFILPGGGLVYRAPAGFAGKDTITYQVRDDDWTVQGKVIVNVLPSNYWYVQANAAGDGRDRSPFGTIAAAQAAAGTGDSIFVLTPANGTSAVDGAAVLKNGQALLGQGVSFDVTRALNGGTVMVFDGTGAAPGLTRTAAGATVTLAQNNVIRGLGIASTAGPAIQAPAPFGTLFVRETDVVATGPALDVATGTLDAVFNTLSAVNSTSSGLTLTGVDGSLTATGGAISITGAGGTAISITGGVNVSYPGAVTQSTNNPLLAVGSHTGTLTLGGALSATTGTGAQFNGANGAYTFNGAVTISATTGNYAGIDVRNSTGTFSFPVGASAVSTTSGPALYVGGGAPTLTYAGTLTNDNDVPGISRPLYVDGITGGAVTLSGAVSNTGPGILIEDNTGGTVTVSGSVEVSGSAGQGIRVQNNGGTASIRFTGSSKHIHSTSNITGVYLLNNTGATIAFEGGGLNIDMPGASGSGFVAQGGGTVTVTGANNVVNVSLTAVEITNTTIGAGGFSLRSVTASSGTTNRGVSLTGTGAGRFEVTGTGAAGTGGSLTGVDTAVYLSNVGGTVDLANVNVGSGVQTGVFGGTFGTLALTGVSITTAGGPALNLTGGALSGSASLTAPNSSTNGLVLTNVTGSLTATGGGMSVSAVPGAGSVFEVNGGSVSVSYTGGLTGVAPTPLLRVTGGHTGTLALDGTNSMLMSGSPGMRFENADGTYNVNVTAGTTALSGDSAGIDILPGTDGANGSQGTFQFGAPGNGFAITSGAGTAFNFQGSAADVVFNGGITRNGTQTGRLVDITGQRSLSAITFQTGTLSATSSSAQSMGILLSDADGSVAFNGTTTLNGGDAGIDVENGSTGTIGFAGTASVTNATNELIRIVNSAPTFTYSGAFQRTTGNTVGILAQNNTGGSITFNGDGTTLDGDGADVAKSLSTGTGNAVSLVSNGGTTFTFAGGMTLAATSGTPFNATGGGTVNVSGAGNTVSTTGGGTAVNVQNTTIGGSGINLLSVNATGGGTNGIVLLNTGAGGFQVTGDGASDAGNTTRGRTTARNGGGTITLGSGGTISGKSGDAVSLSTTGAVVLRNMVIQNNSGDGVQASSAAGVTIDNTRITGHTDNSGLFFTGVGAPTITHAEIENNAFGGGAPGADIHNVRLISNTGTGSVTSSVIANTSAGAERQLQVYSTTGTLNLTVTNNRIAGSTLGDGVGVYAFGSSNITANFQNDSIHDNSAFGIDSGTETTQSASLNITVNNSKFRNNFVGVTVAHGSSGTNTFNVTNNNFQNHGSVSVNVNRLGAVGFTGFGLFSGTVSGNVIGTAGVANSGSPLGSNAVDVKTNGNGGTTRVSVVNNTIREVGNDGIRVIGRDANAGHTLHARIQNNNIANFHASALSGIRGELGAASGDVLSMCLDISGNTVTGAPQNGIRVRAVAGGSPPPQIALTMPSYDGSGGTYLANRNPAASGQTAAVSFANGNAGSTTTAGNCTTP